MAFDFSSIEGFREDMTAEEKLQLLESYEPPKPEPTPTPAPTPEPVRKPGSQVIAKSQFDKLASELAAAKKQLRSKMTEDEQKEAERVAQQEAIQQELEALRRDKALSTYKASYLSLGFDEQLSADTAEGMVDGDMERVFANMRKANEAMRKALQAEFLKNTPVPPAGNEQEDAVRKRKEENERRISFGLPPLKD